MVDYCQGNQNIRLIFFFLTYFILGLISGLERYLQIFYNPRSGRLKWVGSRTLLTEEWIVTKINLSFLVMPLWQNFFYVAIMVQNLNVSFFFSDGIPYLAYCLHSLVWKSNKGGHRRWDTDGEEHWPTRQDWSSFKNFYVKVCKVQL